MRILLHILTQPSDDLARQLIDQQRLQPGHQIEIADLTQPEPDYTALIEKIFTADSVAVW